MQRTRLKSFLQNAYRFASRVALIAFGWLVTSPVLAGGLGASVAGLTGGGGGKLPWDKPVSGLRESMAANIGPAGIVIAIVVTGVVMAFRGDLEGMGPKLLAGFVAGAAVVGATALMGSFGGQGALLR